MKKSTILRKLIREQIYKTLKESVQELPGAKEWGTEKLLSQLQKDLKAHDWWYMMSDDHRWYLSGTQSMKEIRELIGIINSAGLTEPAKKLWIKYAPKEFRNNYPEDLMDKKL